MASPSQSLATQRPDLAALFEFDLEASWGGFIGYEMFPVQDVGRQAGVFSVIKLKELLQHRDVARAPGAGYGRDQHQFEPRQYACQDYGAEEVIDDRETAMYADYYDQEAVSTMRAYDAVLRAAEQRVADACAAITGTYPAGTTWNTWATATPITDVAMAKKTVRESVGIAPNVLQVEWQGFQDLINCDEVVDRVKYQGYMDARPGAINRQALATALDVDRVIVSGDSAMKNTANKPSDPSLETIWDKTQAILAVVATDSDIRQPCIGRTFHWGGEGVYNDGSRIGGTVETYREENVRGGIARVRHDVDEVTIYDAVGIRITSTYA